MGWAMLEAYPVRSIRFSSALEILRAYISVLLEQRLGYGDQVDLHSVPAAQPAGSIESNPMNGQSLSHYEILDPLGAGGMGDVYRARDKKLGREVAIKVLPEEFSSDPDRLARFEREARVLASMNHPHIAQIHGLEEDNGQRFLVLELVEGETMADRIARGRIPVDEALPIALQVALAFQSAHGRGVVHRDLKPANIMLTPAGEAKVLDFGIAKPLEAAAGQRKGTRTLDGPPTRPGVVLGTPAYTSPEQLRGERADKRSDIWAFGVVLWEMLTGRSLFDRKTDFDTLAAVLESTPDWEGLPSSTPDAIHRLLRRCLERDPRQRLHEIADARLEIDEAINGPKPTWFRNATSSPRLLGWLRGVWPVVIASAAAGAFFATAVWNATEGGPAIPRPPARVALNLPSEVTIDVGHRPALAISPDGQWLVFEAREGAQCRLFKRSLERFETIPIPGTENGNQPFFSPDGVWLGFFADGKLAKVPLSGGARQILADAPNPRGASWGPRGRIVFAPDVSGGLWQVDATGGAAEPLIQPDVEDGELDFRWPEFLPDGTGVLFTSTRGMSPASARIECLWVEYLDRYELIENATFARFVGTGHLIFGHRGSVHVAPFDSEWWEMSGPPVPVPDRIHYDLGHGVPQLAVAGNGSLVFVPGNGSRAHRAVTVNRHGSEGRSSATEIKVVFDWFEELKQLAPTDPEWE
jgi:serine/threonine-protein kinase